MASNLIQEGRALDFEITADVSSGDAVIVGTYLGVAENDGVTGDLVPMNIKGVYLLPLETGGGDLGFGAVVALNTAGEVTGETATTGELAAAGKVACNGSLGADTHIEILLTPDSANVAA